MASTSGLPMSLARFEASVPLGSQNRLLLAALRRSFQGQVHTQAEWQALIDEIKAQPVSYQNLQRPAGR